MDTTNHQNQTVKSNEGRSLGESLDFEPYPNDDGKGCECSHCESTGHGTYWTNPAGQTLCAPCYLEMNADEIAAFWKTTG